MRIVFFGDSLIWGGYGGSFVAGISRNCPDHEIINAGVGGNTVLNLLRRVDDDVIAHHPDGVFVMVGGNDAVSYSQPETRAYYKKAQDLPDGMVTPEQFVSAFRDLLTRLYLEHIQVWVGLAPAEYSPEVAAAKKQYNLLAEEVARSFNAPVLDLYAHFTPAEIQGRPPITWQFINLIGERSRSGWSDYEGERDRSGFTYSFDGLHFTPAAAAEAARLIIDFLGLKC